MRDVTDREKTLPPPARRKAVLYSARAVMDQAGKYIFKIFVNGVSPEQSVTALTNLLELCRRHLPPGYEVQPIDVNVHPKLVQQYGVTAVPTTIRESPEPILRATGDLSDPQAA